MCIPLLWKWYTWGFLEMNCACDRFQFPCHLECRIPSLQADLEWVLCFCVYKPEKTHGYQSLGFLMSTHTLIHTTACGGCINTHTHAHTSHHTLHWKKWLREKTLSATPRGRTSVSTTLDPTLNQFSYTPPLPHSLGGKKTPTHLTDKRHFSLRTTLPNTCDSPRVRVKVHESIDDNRAGHDLVDVRSPSWVQVKHAQDEWAQFFTVLVRDGRERPPHDLQD